ncbi:MAG: aminotransferase class IV [SAR324 cluster bacterium]
MATQEITYWVNGAFVPASQAVVPLNSRGYRLGDGVFDTERTFNGSIFRLKEHLERLDKSLRMTRIHLGMSLDDLAAATDETMRRNLPLLETHGDFWVTQTVSRSGGKSVLDEQPAFVSIIVEPLSFARFAPYYTKGMPVVTPSVRSSASIGLDPKIKSTSRLNMVLADLEAKQRDPDAMSALLDEQGNLAEVLYGNLFVVRKGTIRTPGSRGILEGITRATTIELARKQGVSVEEAELTPYDLYAADEAFATTTSYCIMPVGTLNGSPIGKAVPGALTRKLTDAWRDLVGLDFVAQMQHYAARATQPHPVPAAPGASRAAAR